MNQTTEHQAQILACVDRSHYADYVVDYAAWVAERMSLPLELLHIIDRHPEVARSSHDHSGAIGFDAQENLLNELTEQDEAFSKAAREEGRVFLNALRDRARALGVEWPNMRLRHGELEATLTEFQPDVQMFVLGRRGKSAETTQRDMGRNVERVVRALNRPILTVTDSFKAPERVMIAFDNSAVTRKGVELVASWQLFKGLPIHVITSGEPGKGARRGLAWAQEKLESAGHDVHTALLSGDPERVVAGQLKEREIDLLVMGAYTHSFWRSLIIGSKTSDLLRSASVPTLLLR